MSPRSLWWRALVALALMVGFYLLSIGIVLGLLAIPYFEWRELHRVHLKILLFCVVGAVIILWSVIPRRDRFTPPGPRLTPQEQPKLFEEIRHIASLVRQKMPKEVYLVADVNAWVAERGGMMGLGSRRVMGLGLPLLSLLTVAQLRSVLVHEFGHYHGGDTKLGPWVYKTRSAIGRTVQGLGEYSGLLQGIFTSYAKLFLRVSHAVSRSQELAADRLAAMTVGTRPLIEGLKTIHRVAPAHSAYWSNEVAPVLQAGFRPPLEEGFARFLAAPTIRESLDRWEQAQRDADADPHDTHPPLQARIEAVKDLPETAADEQDDRRALELLDHGSDIEGMLLTALAGPHFVAKTSRVEWDDVGEWVFVPLWQRATRQLAPKLQGIRVAGIADVVSDPRPVVHALFEQEPRGLDVGALQEILRQPIGAVIATALLDRGGQLQMTIGEPETISIQGEKVRPFTLVSDLASRKMSGEDWQRVCARLGIEDLDLADVARPEREREGHCPRCGVRLGSQTSFCASCGNPVAGEG